MATVYFRNPTNNFVVKTSMCWLWALLFGPFYFGYKGLWGNVALGMIAGLLTVGLSWLIYPFFAGMLVRSRYREMGWHEVPGMAAST